MLYDVKLTTNSSYQIPHKLTAFIYAVEAKLANSDPVKIVNSDLLLLTIAQ